MSDRSPHTGTTPAVVIEIRDEDVRVGDARTISFEGVGVSASVDPDGKAHITIPGGGGGPSPATTVTDETTFGIAPAVGVAATYAREDHTHGSPTNPVPAHEAAGDPHPQYTTAAEATVIADASVTTHVGLADPHTQYQKESEKAAANGYASLDAGTKIPVAQIPAHASTHQNGGADEISVAGLSGLLADGQTPLAHAASHQLAGSDAIKLDDLAAPDDNTDLDASTLKHGLMQKYPGGTTNFLRADGTFAAPTATAADPSYSPGSFTVVTETQRFAPHRLQMTGSQRITVEGTGRLSCLH